MFEELERLRQKHGIEGWKAKFVQRKYAFEEQDVQKGESEWLKVVYGFDGEYPRPRSPASMLIVQNLNYPRVADPHLVISLEPTPRHSSCW